MNKYIYYRMKVSAIYVFTFLFRGGKLLQWQVFFLRKIAQRTSIN